MSTEFCIAYTTLTDKIKASWLAMEVIEDGLAACVQLSGPITSYYYWEGKIQEELEFRLTIKCLKSKVEKLKESVLKLHPGDTPEWVVVDCSDVDERYLAWAKNP